MLKFIDIETGDVFDGTGKYVHWFDEGQSTNINYCKEIVFISDVPSVNIIIEDNPYFKLMDFMPRANPDDPTQTIDPTQTENLNGFDYYNINNFLVSSLTLQGISYNGVYLYRFFVYTFSSSTGEYIVEVKINGEPIQVGADFYPENELITNDLENLGIEIPMQIQKAIYESNVHEEAMDNILVNRKWKELLLEYWNIVANKGSYKSLVNSMKFFEYGDLVKIMEFWKVHYNKDILISNDLEQILNDRFREQLSVLSKTTYTGLYLALEKIKHETDAIGDYVPTEFDENLNDPLAQDNPILDRVSTIWSALDLSLKMTLVGNFFSTYFMPLHLDLIHSTIEDICFTNTIKIISSGVFQRKDYIDRCNNFLSSVKKEANYYIKPQDVYVNSRTILGYKEFDRVIDDDTSNDGRGYGPTRFDSGEILRMDRVQDDSRYYDEVSILGVDTEADTSYIQNAFAGSGTPWEFVFSGANIIHKFGALVPIDVKITSNVSGDDAIKSAEIHWVRDSKQLFDYVDNATWIEPIEIEDEDGNPTGHWKYEFDFNLLFQNPGKYHFFVTFTSTKSFIYSREFIINVLDDADNPIHIYKVERVDPKEYKDLEIQVSTDPDAGGTVTISNGEYSYNINDYMFTQTFEPESLACSQYICADILNMQKNTGLNHVIIFTTSGNSPDAKVDGIPANTVTVSQLESNHPEYWWFERNIYTDIDSAGILDVPMNVITGIRKYFTINNKAVILYDNQFHRGEDDAVVKVIQIEGLMYVIVTCSNGIPGSINTYKIADYAHIEVFGHPMDVRVYPDYNWYHLEYDSNNEPYGLAENKVKCEGNFFQLVDEDRFIPIFHKLVKVEENNCEVLPSELMVAIPELKRTYKEHNEIVWEFLNSSTMENTIEYKAFTPEFGANHMPIYKSSTSIDFMEPYIGKFEPRVLTPGYYNINLHYQYGNEEHCESRDGAFKIRKKI